MLTRRPLPTSPFPLPPSTLPLPPGVSAADLLQGADVYVQVGGAWKKAQLKNVDSSAATTAAGDKVALKDVATISENAKSGMPDMIKLDVLHSASILDNLEVRFFRDEIYTNVGSVLLSVNPFKRMEYYTNDHVWKYAKASALDLKNFALPPHIYSTAKTAYETMLRSQGNQSVLISGESGAGKTEATKYVLQYLTTVSKGPDAEGGQSAIERMIVDSSPILEAFGNAKTVRNNNSSRFGKFFDIQFNGRGEIVGGKITDYLLEKSRVVQVAKDERSYHVFYQLCAGASDTEREKYKISTADKYQYLQQSGCTQVANIDDAAEYRDLLRSFNSCKVTALEVDAIKRILTSVLHLGNSKFKGDADSPAELDGTEAVDTVAELLQINEGKLRGALISRTMSTGGGRGRGSVYKIQLKPSEALATRDALAKGMYVKLFRWLVLKITENMIAQEGHAYTIGVLDIFGFEVMPVNSFEQLCINFANEKLHQQFIDYVFKLEIEEYEKEKLGIKVDYTDNEECLKLIETKGTGILPMLHEQCQLGARGSEDQWRDAMNDKFRKHTYYVEERKSRTDFSINHYANKVTYDTTGCLDKNKDQLNADLQELMSSSLQPEINDILTSGTAPSRRGVVTVSNQFMSSLTSLTTVIRESSPHYVRCLKSTEEKKPGIFDGVGLNRQLGYSGVLETIKIRIAGYAVRFGFSAFVSRFHMLLKGASNITNDKEAVLEILRKCNVNLEDKSQIAVGIHKIFLKSEETLLRLESEREKIILHHVVRIQNYWRMILAQRLLVKLRIEEKKRIEEEIRRKKEEEERKKREAEEARLLEERKREADKKEEEEKQKDEASGAAPVALDQAAEAVEGRETEGLVEEDDTEITDVPQREMVYLPEPILPSEDPSKPNVDDIPKEPAEFSGWLCKEGANTRGLGFAKMSKWTKRYFVLKGREIKYYTDEKFTEQKGSLTLSAGSCCTDIPVAQRKSLPTNVGSNFFQICSEGRTMRVACPRADDVKEWYDKVALAARQIEGSADDGATKEVLVHLPDGSTSIVKLKENQGAKDAFLKLAKKINVRGMQFFSLVETVQVNDGMYLQRVLSERDNLNIIKPSNRLIFKKVVFEEEMDPRADSGMLLDFLYTQAVTDLLSFMLPEEKDLVRHAALMLKIKEVTIDPVIHTRGFLTNQMHEYLSYGTMRKATRGKIDDWEAKVLNKVHDLEASGKTLAECKMEYVQMAMDNPAFGAAYYPVVWSKGDGTQVELILAVNCSGLHLLYRRSREFFKSFYYETIMKWGRSMATFNFTSQDEQRWEFETEQGEEINKFMGIYIKLLLESRLS